MMRIKRYADYKSRRALQLGDESELSVNSGSSGITSSSQAKTGMLYLVATPIGNLEDLSPRAARVLAEVDMIAAEDTRQIRKLLSHLGLSKECFSYHQHNRFSAAQKILHLLRQGKQIALVSDAGMPLISDPGEELVALLQAERMQLTVIPGPSAALAALSVSGLATDRFVFEGFLPAKGSDRQQRILALQGEERTLLLYEAPHRLKRTLTDLAIHLGESRQASLVRELTKVHEEVIPGTLGDLLRYFEDKEVRGECVLVIAGAEPLSPPQEQPETALQCYQELLAAGMARKAALKEAARRSGIGRDQLYQLLLWNNAAEESGEDKNCT